MKYMAVLAATLAGACGRDPAQLNCANLLPPSQTSYTALAAIITNERDPRNCASCHNSAQPVFDLDLGTPDAAYFTLRDHMDHIYPQIASGDMPQEGSRWSDNDVRLLRSWYCQGALRD